MLRNPEKSGASHNDHGIVFDNNMPWILIYLTDLNSSNLEKSRYFRYKRKKVFLIIF